MGGQHEIDQRLEAAGKSRRLTVGQGVHPFEQQLQTVGGHDRREYMRGRLLEAEKAVPGERENGDRQRETTQRGKAEIGYGIHGLTPPALAS